MRSFQVKPYVIRVYLVFFGLFLITKIFLRPWVLARDLPAIFDIFVLSLPNASEAVMGTTTVVALLLLAKFHYRPRYDSVPDVTAYLVGTLLAAIYVLTQEFNIHSLGGNNTFDPYDVAASVMGLTAMLLLFCRYGFVAEGSNPS